MPDLRALGQQVVDQPFREPTPVAVLQGRAHVYNRRRQRLLTVSSLGLATVMVVALVGLARTASGAPGGAASATARTTTTTTTAAAAEATTSTPASGLTTSTAAPAPV